MADTLDAQSPGDLGYNGFPVSLFYLAAVDVESIDDHSVSIVFKNMMKKNSVTREKGLTEFLRLIETNSFNISDFYILVCWLQIFPRMGIDASKVVRALAIQIQALYMEKYGAKEFSRYLKSSIPTWLNALFDERSIALSAKNGLVACFGNDPERVDVKIWAVFHEQIINYCHAALVHETAASIIDQRYETAEELVIKYNRVVTSALLMLTNLIRLVNNGHVNLSEKALVQAESILSSEEVWNLFDVCLAKDSMSMPLFKTLLTLVGEVFTLDKENHPTNFTSSLVDLKGIYKVLCKKFIKLVNLEVSQNSKVIYSSVMLSFLDCLTALTSFTTLRLDSKKHKLKKNFWVLGGSKSFSRFRTYLKVGPCNSGPVYYEKLSQLFLSISLVRIELTDEFQFLDYSNPDHAKLIVKKILIPQLDTLKGFDSLEYKLRYIKCIFEVLSLFSEGCGAQSVDELHNEAFLSVLDSIASPVSRKAQEQLRLQCLRLLGRFGKDLALDFESVCNNFIDSITHEGPVRVAGYDLKSLLKDFCIALYDMSDDNLALQTLFLEKLLEKSEECFEPVELEISCSIILHILRSNPLATEPFLEWSLSLASLISENFVEFPLDIFESLLKLKLNLDYKIIFEDFFTKILSEAPTHLKRLLSLLSQIDIVDKVSLEESFPEAHAYLIMLSQSTNRLPDEDAIIFSYLDDQAIFNNVIRSSVSEFGTSEILRYLATRNQPFSDRELSSGLILKLLDNALSSIEDSGSQAFLALFEDKRVVQDAVFKRVQLQQVSKHLTNYLSQNEEFLPILQMKYEVSVALSSVDLRSLALANPLGHNILLIEDNQKVELRQITPLIIFLTLLLVESKSGDLVRLGAICLELLHDYAFLQNAESALDSESQVSETLDKIVWLHFKPSSEFVVAVGNGTSIDNVLIDFAQSISGKGPFKSLQFYQSRVLSRALSSSLENMSQSEFDSLGIGYALLVNHPLKLATVLTSASQFLANSTTFDRTRTYVFSEILGVQTSNQILTSGIQWTCLSTNFLETAEYGAILATHKLGMVFNKISDWLNSDIAFDSEFLSMRYLLSVFFTKLIEFHSESLPEKVWEISIDICLNNLSTAQVEPSNLSLRYSTMKLFIALTKHIPDTVPEWKEARTSIFEELAAILIDKEVEKESNLSNNRPVALCNELLERIFTRNVIPKQVLQPKVHSLYGVLDTSRFVSLQRTAVSLLELSILETQQDVVVEYQLKRSKLGDDSDDEGLLPPLQKSLLDSISVTNNRRHLEDLIADGQFHQVMRFVWSWLLVFKHFQDTTFNIKLEYINQTKDDMEFLFDTIFDTIWPSDPTFLNKLVKEPIDKGAKVSTENCLIQTYSAAKGFVGHELQDEVHFVLVHLYYLSFQYLGSYVQQWYNKIRDLQQKLVISKFSVNYLSPLLVTKMLDEVEQSKGRLTSMDDNLTVRVNRVTNEIKSIYVIDEQTMEMIVKIPHTYPLSSVTVEGPLRLGVKESQWKAWLLASQRVISLTNGSIIDSIELFNRNVNLHFSGFVECAICYSILHQDHSLPSKTCPTCLNKFHSACLYKWFKSSGSSTCPLCRSTFNFKLNRS